jgi:hypothetical protein
MEGILLILLILVLIAVGRVTGAGSRRGGIIVKPKNNSERPKVGPAPQPFVRRNKYGRTADEQELHEWMEDNPR